MKKYDSNNFIDDEIADMLLLLGVPPQNSGYFYLKEAVKLAFFDPFVINALMKKLYPRVGEKFNVSASNVERAMRHSVKVAWDRNKKETVIQVFGAASAYIAEVCPTNSEFIAIFAETLRKKHSKDFSDD